MTDITNPHGYALTDFVVGLGAQSPVAAGTIKQEGPITVTPTEGTVVIGTLLDAGNGNLHIIVLNPLP